MISILKTIIFEMNTSYKFGLVELIIIFSAYNMFKNFERDFMCSIRIGAEFFEDLEAAKIKTKIARRYAVFFLITASILWGGIAALVLLQIKMSIFPIGLAKALSTGIHVPIVFFVCSRIILLFQKIIFNSSLYPKISEKEIANSIFIIVFFLDLCLLLIDWELALFVMAILCGKLIWMDSVFNLNQMWENATRFILCITGKQATASTSDIAVYYGHQMLGTIFFEYMCLFLISLLLNAR